jgi:O-antigen ligase
VLAKERTINVPWQRFVSWSLAATAAAMPLYVVRWRVGPLPTTLLESLILVTAALYAVAVWRKAMPLPRRTPLDIPIALFLVAGVIGILVAPDPRGALGIYRAYLLEPVAIYYIATSALEFGESVRWVLAGWGVGAVAFGAVEIATFLRALYDHSLQIGNAAAAFNINPNSVALFLESPIALAAGFTLFGRGWDRRLAAVALCVLLPALVFTLSRGGLLAAAAMTLIAVVTVPDIRFRLGLALTGLFGAIAVWQLPVIGLRITYFLVDPSGSLHGREHIWLATLRMLQDHPIFGAGVDAYQTVMAPYRAGDVYQVPEPYAHNIVLTSWSELGLLGLFAFLYILVRLMVAPWPALKKASGLYRPLLWGLGTAFGMFAVHGMIDSPYWKNDLSVEFWLLAALEIVALRAVSAPEQRV